MDSLFQSILAWVADNPSWAGLIVFFIAFSESLAIAGMVMPGAALLLGVGALIGLGVLEIWGTLGYAVVGAICGDGVSFWLGYHYRDRLRGMWPFTRYPGLLRKGERFFRRHGGKSIVFGRFIGPLRAIMPATAGMMGMSPRHYVVVNVMSSLLWAPVYIMPGALVAASLGLTTAIAVRLTVLLLLLIFLLWLTQRLVRSAFHYLQPRAQAIVKAILSWGQHHPLAGRLAAALLDPRRPEALGLAVLALLLVVGAGILLLLLKWVSAGIYPAAADQAVYQLMQGLHSDWADNVMMWMSRLGGTALHLALFFTLLIYMVWRSRWMMVAHWIAVFVFALLLSALTHHLLIAAWLVEDEPLFSFAVLGDVSVSMAL
ncbi:MAG: hypothetical protein GXP10_07525 [Gammaproteobacteria bacterium]|nr:hypothetical protein [Gammaproteobacteria bacterium]